MCVKETKENEFMCNGTRKRVLKAEPGLSSVHLAAVVIGCPLAKGSH